MALHVAACDTRGGLACRRRRSAAQAASQDAAEAEGLRCSCQAAWTSSAASSLVASV